MEFNLRQAKYALACSRKKHTNMEIVLAEIISMSKEKQGLSVSKLSSEITKKLNLSIPLYRKIIYDLYKTGTIKKMSEDRLIYINPALINLKQK